LDDSIGSPCCKRVVVPHRFGSIGRLCARLNWLSLGLFGVWCWFAAGVWPNLPFMLDLT
jgi:hypothetical protein